MKSELNESGSLLLRNGRVVAPDGLLEGVEVFITDGRIERVAFEGAGAGDGAQVLDLRGLMLFPGFIDVHIHGAVGVDTMEAGVDDLARVAGYLAGEGVTAWLPTLVPAPDE